MTAPVGACSVHPLRGALGGWRAYHWLCATQVCRVLSCRELFYFVTWCVTAMGALLAGVHHMCEIMRVFRGQLGTRVWRVFSWWPCILSLLYGSLVWRVFTWRMGCLFVWLLAVSIWPGC